MRYLAGVASLKVDEEACTGCGVCTTVCPHAVLRISDRKARIAELDACMECGACARNCEPKAVTVSAGGGCAQAILRGMLSGGPPECGCGGGSDSPCC